MVRTLAPEAVRAAAALVDLPLDENDVEPVTERLALLLDASDQIAHLAENNAELDLRFSAGWGEEAP